MEGSHHVEAERAIMDGQWKGAMLEGRSNRHALFECLVDFRKPDRVCAMYSYDVVQGL